MIDIVIIGGGPGGLYAAASLARRGFAVTVLEEHESAGEPVHCTGILGAEAYNEFQIPRSAILNELSALRLFSPGGRQISYITDGVHAVVIDRKHFDQRVCAEAERLGVQLIRGYRAHDIRVSDDRVSIEVPNLETIDARACILACGASYTLQRKLGLGLPPVFLRTAQVEVPTRERASSVEIHFGLDVAPHGFAWAVPVHRPTGHFARIGLMCRRDPGAHFDRFIGRIRDRWGIDYNVQQRPRLKMLPLAPIPRTYLDRVVVIGDAAGLVKPTTGGGIYYSILSGDLAADVLADGLKSNRLGADFLQKYETGWRKRLSEEFDAQLTLRKIAQSLKDDDIENLFELAQTDGIIPLIRSTARFNQHKDLIVALFKHPEARKILLRNFATAFLTPLRT